jgi:hypothetical protein
MSDDISIGGDNSGIASTGDNANIVQAQTISGTVVQADTVNFYPGGVPARSQYLHQVRRIAPLELRGRESELAELAAFCTSSEAGYAWWRA